MKINERELKIVGSTSAQVWIIQPEGENETEYLTAELAEIEKINPTGERCIAALTVSDWNSELSPWEAEAVFGNENFGSGAERTLEYIVGSVIPALNSAFPAEERKYYLCGYSLAGLFALWAGYRSDVFSGVAGVSPSVWFPDWLGYAQTHSFRSGAAYLSLGDREEKAKNPRLASVGDALRRQHELLLTAGIPCTLEWNPGGHFKDADKRLAKAIAWLEKMKNAFYTDIQ